MPNIPTTISRSWTSRAYAPPELLRAAAFAIAVLVVELLLARGVTGPQISRYVYLFVGLFAVAFVFRFPLATTLVFFVLSDSIFFPLHFAHQLGAVNVRPYEVILVLLVLLAAVRPKRRTWGGTAGGALAVFFVFVAISAALGIVTGGVSLTEAFNWSRPLAPLTLFYVVIRRLPSPQERRVLIAGLATVAAATGIVALLASTGAAFSTLPRETNGIVEEAKGGVERVRLPGLSAGYALFWFTAMQISVGRGFSRLRWFALLVGIGIDIVVSYNRNMWIGIGLGMVLMAVLAGPAVRSRLATAIAVLLSGFVIFALLGGSAAERTFEPILKRGATLVSPSKTSQENSLESRALETSEAWSEFKRHPIFGVGAGASFGVYLNEPVKVAGVIVGITRLPQQYLHNQYLYLLLISGPGGLIAFLVFLGVPLAYALRRRGDPDLLALGVGIAMIGASAFVAIYFSVVDMTAVLGLLTGAITAYSQDPGRHAEAEAT